MKTVRIKLFTRINVVTLFKADSMKNNRLSLPVAAKELGMSSERGINAKE